MSEHATRRQPVPDLLDHLGHPARHHRRHAGRGEVPPAPAGSWSLFLLAFMMVKAAMIGGNFMHLRFERRTSPAMVGAGHPRHLAHPLHVHHAGELAREADASRGQARGRPSVRIHALT